MSRTEPLAVEATGVGDAAGTPAVYRTKDVVSILGISRRQLQYWAQTDLVVPSVKTRGGHHRYTFEDLVALKATKRLLDAGVSVQRIRSSIRALRRSLPRIARPLSELTLVATGDVVLVLHDGSAFEAVSGQEWVFEVARFERELAAWRDHSGTEPRRTQTSLRREDENGGPTQRNGSVEPRLEPKLQILQREPRAGGG